MTLMLQYPRRYCVLKWSIQAANILNPSLGWATPRVSSKNSHQPTLHVFLTRPIYSLFHPRNMMLLTYSGTPLIVRLCSPILNLRSVMSPPAPNTSPTSHDGITADAVEIFSATCTPCTPFLSIKMPITIQKVAAAAHASTAGLNIVAGNWHAPAGQTARARMMTRKHPQHLP